MDNPALIVTGLGRCGTTLIMTMLDAGGFPVTGPRPSYEVPAAFGVGRADAAWINAHSGQAIKVIDPTICPITRHKFAVPPIVICMTRDPAQQARSQIKFAGITSPDRAMIKAMKRSITRDTPIMRAKLSTMTPWLYHWTFEDLLRNPMRIAAHMQAIIRAHYLRPFDVAAAVRVVLERPAACMSDNRIEQYILPQLATLLPSEAPHA